MASNSELADLCLLSQCNYRAQVTRQLIDNAVEMINQKEKLAILTEKHSRKDKNSKRIFFSYSKRYRQFINIKRYLANKHQINGVNVDIDDNEAGHQKGKNRKGRWQKEIGDCQLFCLFFDNAYVDSSECRAQFSLALRKKIPVIPIRIVSSRKARLLDQWEPFLKRDSRWIEWNVDDEEDPQILQLLCSKLSARIQSIFEHPQPELPLRSAKITHFSHFRNKTFATVGIPSELGKCFHMKNAEEKFLRHFRDNLLNDVKTLTFKGPHFIGKTTFLAKLFHEDSNNDSFFVKRCKINAVFWVSMQDIKDKSTLLAEICRQASELVEKVDGPTNLNNNFYDLDDVSDYFLGHDWQALVIFDDISNQRLEIVYECVKNCQKFMNFIAIVDDKQPLEGQFQSVFNFDTTEDFKNFVRVLLEPQGSQENALEPWQIEKVEKLCFQSPLVANILCQHVKNIGNDEELFRELVNKVENLSSPSEIVDHLVSDSLQKLQKPYRNCIFASLMFQRGETFKLEDIAIFWGFFNLEEDSTVKTRALMMVFEKAGLVRHVGRDKYLVEKLVFDSCQTFADEDENLGDLHSIRWNVLKGLTRIDVEVKDEEGEEKDQNQIIKEISNQKRWKLLEIIVKNLQESNVEHITFKGVEGTFSLMSELLEIIGQNTNEVIDLIMLIINKLGEKRFIKCLKLNRNFTEKSFILRNLLVFLTNYQGRNWKIYHLKALTHRCKMALRHIILFDAQFSDDFETASQNIEGLITMLADPDLIEMAWDVKKRAMPEVLITSAARNGHLEAVKLFGTSIKSWNWNGSDGWTPLMHSLSNGFIEIAEHLEMLSDQKGMANEQAAATLFAAVRNGEVEGVDFLFSHFNKFLIDPLKLSWKPAEKDQQNLMLIAAKQGQTEILKLLNKQWPSLVRAQTEENGQTPLLAAVQNGYLESVKFLSEIYLESVMLENLQGETPLMVATKGDHLEIAKFLYQLQPDAVDITDRDDFSVLAICCKMGFLDLANFFITKCPESCQWREYKEGNIPSMIAVTHNQNEIAKIIVSKFSETILITNNEGHNVFAVAVANGNLEAAKFIYENCRDVAKITTENENSTPLLLAAKNGHLDLVEFLYETWPEAVSLINSQGLTPASVAAVNGHHAVVKFLLDK